MAAAAAVVLIASASTIVATRGGHQTTADGGLTPPGSARLVATSAQRPPITEESGRTYTPSSLPALAPSLVAGGLSTASSTATTTGAGSGSSVVAVAQCRLRLRRSAPGQLDLRRQSSLPPHQPLPRATRPARVPEDRRRSPRRTFPHRFGATPTRSRRLKCAAFITDTPGAAPLAVDYARWTNPKTNARRVPALVLVFAIRRKQRDRRHVVAPAYDDSSLLDFQLCLRADRSKRKAGRLRPAGRAEYERPDDGGDRRGNVGQAHLVPWVERVVGTVREEPEAERGAGAAATAPIRIAARLTRRRVAGSTVVTVR